MPALGRILGLDVRSERDKKLLSVAGHTDPPWRWSREDTAISVVHHAIFAGATSAAYEALAGVRS